MGYLSSERLASVLVGVPLVTILCVCLLIVALYSETGRRFFSNRILTFFGKYSYAIYLFHLPVRAVIRDTVFGDAQFRQLPFSPYLGQLIFYIVATLAVIPPALISWHLFEKRFLRLKRYFESPSLRKRPTSMAQKLGVPAVTPVEVEKSY